MSKIFDKHGAEVFNFVKSLNANHRLGGEVLASALGQFVAREFNFGQLGHRNNLKFSLQDLMELNREIAQLTGNNPAWDNYTKLTRPERAKSHHSTKLQVLPVSEDFVLVNCLGSLKINQHVATLPPLSALGVYLNASEFNSIEHEQLILVENLAVMASLALLKLPEAIDDPLFVYRGDVKPEQNITSAYQFFRRWSSSHQLLCFSDFDPAGLLIATSSGATCGLAPTADSIDDIFSTEFTDKALKDSEQNWWQQAQQKTALESLIKQDSLSPALITAFQQMANYRRTWQQEHMITHQTPLQLIAL